MRYLILLLATAIILALELKTKKRIQYLSTLPLLLMFFFFITSNNFDFTNYMRFFVDVNIMKSSNVELGYTKLVEFIKFLGGDFITLRVILAIIFFKIYFIEYNKTKYRTLIIFIYILYFFIWDVTQIRNTIVCILIFVSLNIDEKSKNWFLNIIAILFQRVSFIYLGFNYLKNIEIKKYIKYIKILFIVILLGTTWIREILILLFPQKTLSYLKIKQGYGYYIYYLMAMFDLLALKLTNNFETGVKKNEVYLKFYLYMIIFIPLGGIQNEIIRRLYRNTFLIKSIYIAEELEHSKGKNSIIVWGLIAGSSLIIILAELTKSPEWVLKFIKSL